MCTCTGENIYKYQRNFVIQEIAMPESYSRPEGPLMCQLYYLDLIQNLSKAGEEQLMHG